jgi:hypothetical protein
MNRQEEHFITFFSIKTAETGLYSEAFTVKYFVSSYIFQEKNSKHIGIFREEI